MAVRKIFKTHWKSLNGQFAKRKGIPPEDFESRLELDLLCLLALDPRVEGFECQPVRVPLKSGGFYTPDVLVKFVDDPAFGPPMRPWLIEVKYRNELQDQTFWEKNRPKYKAAIKFANDPQRQWRFKILTDREITTPYLTSARFLLANLNVAPSPAMVKTILEVLGECGLCEAVDLVELTGEPAGRAERLSAIWWLVAARQIWADLGSPLVLRRKRPIVMLRLPDATPDPAFYWTEGGPPLARTYFRSLVANPALAVRDPHAPHQGIQRFSPGTKAMAGDRLVTIKEPCDLEHVIVRVDKTRRQDKVSIFDLSPLPPTTIQRGYELSLIPEDKRLQSIHRRDALVHIEKTSQSTEQMKAVAISLGVSLATLYRWRQKFRDGGEIPTPLMSVSPNGGRGKSRLGNLEALVQWFIENEYLTRQKPTMATVYRSLQDECDIHDLPPPAMNTFRSRILAIPLAERLKARVGSRVAREATRVDRGFFPHATHPLAIVQIDMTPSDVILLDPNREFAITRGKITYAEDVFSRAIVGIDFSLATPGGNGTGRCLANAVLPKGEFLRRRGIDAEWPCCGLADAYHLDNAKDYRGINLKLVAGHYHFNLQHRPVMTPQFGGHIEACIKTLSSKIHNLPGTTKGSIKERGDYDSAAHAVMTVEDFDRWLVNQVIIYNNDPHRGINGRSPIQMYQEGILPTKWTQGRGLPPLPADPVRFRLDLLPFKKATIKTNGVELNGNFYTSPVLDQFLNATDPNATTKTQKCKFLFRYDSNDIGLIYFWNPDLCEYQPIPAKATEMVGVTLKEDQDWKSTVKAHAALLHDKDLVRRLEQANSLIVAQATAATKKTKKERQAAARSGAMKQQANEHAAEVQVLVAPVERPASEPPRPVNVVPMHARKPKPMTSKIEEMEW